MRQSARALQLSRGRLHLPVSSKTLSPPGVKWPDLTGGSLHRGISKKDLTWYLQR